MRAARRLTAMVLIVTLIPLLADGRPPPRRAAASASPSATRPRVDPLAAVRALHVVMPNIDVKELPFDEFCDWLARQSGVNVLPRWPQLEKCGVKRDTPVTLTLKDATLAKALRDVLTALADEKSPLGFRAHENTITISSKADLDRLMIVKVYDIQDLIAQTPNFRGMIQDPGPGFQLREQPADDKLKGADEATRELVDLIIDHVYPDSWKVHGGSGTISYLRGRLVVRNTPEVHEALGGQLSALRQ